jgi:hypothetical protein
MELLRRQLAVFADMVNGQIGAMIVAPPEPHHRQKMKVPIGAIVVSVEKCQHRKKTSVVVKQQCFASQHNHYFLSWFWMETCLI